ncbi:acetate/propionate family kinase [Mucilaginibacter gilvus]|uniref:Acetate kinase n=1 Tax=Mucilaginibacter gilvus TaxID=2305909 RepID=A0A3S3UR03_9SPHI|nr:acetate/propionate family kinase [Mucilaginibacter gilvus]RWY46190.1 acetate/propionate family kinase [Mucilaginibacter gilvus]
MILTVNGGSSSIKFALYQTRNPLVKIMSGQVTRIGLPGVQLIFKQKEEQDTLSIKATDYLSAINHLMEWLDLKVDPKKIKAIGHRVVHGMEHTAPALITPALLADLKEIIPYDPDHLPNEIKLIEAFQKRHPKTRQYACFDTFFHQDMPTVAKLLPIPRRFGKHGVHKYGFHGISCQYLMNELEKIAGKKVAHGRVIIAHLGNGASLTAVYKGKSIDTSMGFTPAGGLPMSSRSGDLDPGVAWVMIIKEKLSPNQFNHLINHESGLLGISGTSGDMGDLLQQEDNDTKAADAVNHFCYQLKKWIGAYSAVLGGLDTLIFSGGIGENAPIIRSRICENMDFLGIELDKKLNNKNNDLISTATGKVTVRIIPTDEEWMIAKTVSEMTARK